MASLNAEMIEALKATKYVQLATASKAGDPNVAPMGSLFIIDTETIWIGDQFMKTTVQNVLENPRASFCIWTPGSKPCFKVKADVTVVRSGPEYERMKAMVDERKPGLKCRSLLVLKVTEVYNCLPGKDAGAKML
jgi:predicted pyridoxine 5'-phosphate oxidase superfamily flavin-nucleotide-binding protein